MTANHSLLPGRRLRPRLGTLLLLGLTACSGSGLGPGTEPGPPAHLTVTGSAQIGTVGRALGERVVARVTDAEGRPLTGVSVTFTADSEAGGFAPAGGLTDDRGEAASVWTLGAHPGPVGASVSAEGLPSQAISATALIGPAARLAFEVVPGEPIAGVTLEPAIVVLVQDELGNLVTSSTVEIRLRLNKSTLAGTTQTRAVNGRAEFDDLHIDQAGDGYALTAEADGLAVSSTPAFPVAPAPPPTPDAVAVIPGEARIVVGQTVALAATVLDDQGRPIDGVPLVWSSSDPSVAEVDGDGVLTAVSTGSATITATAGGRSGTAEVSVSLGEGTLAGVSSCTIGGVDNLMDVYLPAASHPRPRPVVVHVHGGGWVSGSRSSGERFVDLKPRLVERGYLVVSLDYRLGPAHKFPAQIQDVKCAIRHLRANAGRYGLDPERIGALGGSAGGQLVALLGTADAGAGFDDVGGFPGVSSAVRAVVATSPITDFTHPEELFDDYHRAFETWPDPDSPEMIAASPVTHVNAGDAPFFFIVGEEDALVLPDQSARMNQRLHDAGIASSLLRVQHADHNLAPTGATPISPDSDTIARRIVTFFDDQLP